MIELSNVSKKFVVSNQKRGHFLRSVSGMIKSGHDHKLIWALSDVSININKGETIGLIGPNAAGKSTLFRIIAGIYKPSSGIVKISGEVTAALKFGFGYLSDLSIRDYIFWFGTIIGLEREDILGRLPRILDFAEINDFADTKLRTISSGMKVRLAFSIIIQTRGDIILLDDIGAVGDENFKKKCFNAVKELEKGGKTIIISSHALSTISMFCDRTLLLNKGKVVDFGHTDGVISRYRDLLRA